MRAVGTDHRTFFNMDLLSERYISAEKRKESVINMTQMQDTYLEQNMV